MDVEAMNLRAIPPYRFVCEACGKTSATRYGLDSDHDRGWDAACMLHAVLCKPVELRDSPIHPEWTAVKDPIKGQHFTPVEDA